MFYNNNEKRIKIMKKWRKKRMEAVKYNYELYKIIFYFTL